MKSPFCTVPHPPDKRCANCVRATMEALGIKKDVSR